MTTTQKVFATEMKEVLFTLFRKHKFSEKKAQTLAQVHTENTLHGVHSHGINRVPFFIQCVQNGVVKTNADATPAEQLGSIERWDGNQGSGVLNAIKCSKRAIQLAQSNGISLIALRNTNHWMRAGYYGWLAAENGCIAIMFTNTQPNMPAWGGIENRIGNNPFVVSIPRSCGSHVVLDMALSQFSFGKIHEHALRDEKLPYPGGWNSNGELSSDPESILKTESGLPIGYWKGSAFSMVLDMLATLLAAGQSTYRISQEKQETNISQVFLCIDTKQFHDTSLKDRLLNEIIDYSSSATPTKDGSKVVYPGENSLLTKLDSLKNGMKVNSAIWQQINGLISSS